MNRSAFRGHCMWLLAAALVYGGTAAAQHSPALDRGSVSIGGYYASSHTIVRASTPDERTWGDVDLEDDLGFRERAWSPRVRADILIGDSQGLSFDYYRYRRERSASISEDLSYNGNAYEAKASAHGKLAFDFGSLAYRWWLGKGNDVFGIGLGATYYKVHASISGEASLNGDTFQAGSATGAHAWAPLLQLGWRHAFNDQWRMYVNASGVKKNGGHLYGHIYNLALGMQWFPTKHFGISAEYNLNRIHLQQLHHAFNDRLDLRLDGPSIFATFRY